MNINSEDDKDKIGCYSEMKMNPILKKETQQKKSKGNHKLDSIFEIDGTSDQPQAENTTTEAVTGSLQMKKKKRKSDCSIANSGSCFQTLTSGEDKISEMNNGLDIEDACELKSGKSKNGEKKRKREKKICNMNSEDGSTVQQKESGDVHGSLQTKKNKNKADCSIAKSGSCYQTVTDGEDKSFETNSGLDIENACELKSGKSTNGEKKKRKREEKICNMIPEDGYPLQQDESDDGHGCAAPIETGDGESKMGDKSKKKTKLAENVPRSPGPKRKAKKVSFSNEVKVLDLSNTMSNEGLVRGKRFTKEEDNILREAVFNYIKARGLEEGKGIEMLMKSRSHPELKNCWKEIAAAIPYRPYVAIYFRAHILFERSEEHKWSKEDCEHIRKSQQIHGNNWKLVAAELGRHRAHVKDVWRRIKYTEVKTGSWSQEEYQTLYDLVNKDLQMKVLEQEKNLKYGMLRDNIPWAAISDKMATRIPATCCIKWYKQLTSSMVVEGKWSDGDDYRLIGALYRLDAACEDDVDWDDLLEHRSGEVCRKRWDQMVRHIGHHGLKSFAEQVEILACRYCPELAEAKDTWDNLPVVS